MKIEYLAHSSFLLESNDGLTLITDPYEPNGFDGALTYGPITEKTDIITISHEHADHNYISPSHKEALIIRKTEHYKQENIDITGFATFHDTNKGSERGDNIIFRIKMDNITVCHLGDLGHELSEKMVKKIGKIDILLLPVGGVFTIDAATATKTVAQLAPSVTIPMHYKTEKLAFDLATLDKFTKGKKNVITIDDSEVNITKKDLPVIPEIWTLLPSKI